jgi:hypothetical protein
MTKAKGLPMSASAKEGGGVARGPRAGSEHDGEAVDGSALGQRLVRAQSER